MDLARSLRARTRLIDTGLLILAVALLLSLAFTLFSQELSGSFGYDFTAYYRAAARVAAGHSPYDPAILNGVVNAKGLGNYLYPPPLAQALVPLAALPFQVAASIWLLLQSTLLCAGLALAAWAGGARRAAFIVAGVAVLVVTSLPALDSLLEGNVAGFIVFAVALLLVAPGRLGTGATMTIAGIVKLTPLALLGPMARGGWRAAWGAALALLVVVGVSLAFAPQAWADWLQVLRGQMAGAVTYGGNLAPAAAASLVGLSGLAAWLRVLGPLVGLLLIGAAWFLVRRPATAIALALVGSWLVPPVFWPHYLVALSVPVVYVWSAASLRQRLALLICLAAISVAPWLTPAAWAGVVGAVALVAVIERRRSLATPGVLGAALAVVV